MLDTLLTELLELLFGYLCLSDRLQLSMVCKKLYKVFWQSPAGSDVREGIIFSMEQMSDMLDLLGSRIHQMRAVTHLRCGFRRRLESMMKDWKWDPWEQLAPHLFFISINHSQPVDVFRMLSKCSRIVSLHWRFQPYQEQYLNLPPASHPEGLDAVQLPRLRHLEIDMEIPRSILNSVLNEFISKAGAESALVTLTLRNTPDFEVLHGLVTLHAASLQNLNIPYSDITGQQLVSLGSIPNLRLMRLDLLNCSNVDQKSFAQFLRLQPHLRYLNLNGCEEAIFADDSWAEMKKALTTNLSKLKSLEVYPHFPNAKFDDYLPYLSSLQELSVWSVNESVALSLNKSSCKLLKITIGYNELYLLNEAHLRNLREIQMSGSSEPKNRTLVPNELYARIWKYCPNLEALSIGIVTYDDEDEDNFPVRCNNLRKMSDLCVSLNMCKEWTNDSSVAKLMQLPNLRLVSVYFKMAMSCDDLFTFIHHLVGESPFLESIRLVSLSKEENLREEEVERMLVSRCAPLWPRMKVVFFGPCS